MVKGGRASLSSYLVVSFNGFFCPIFVTKLFTVSNVFLAVSSADYIGCILIHSHSVTRSSRSSSVQMTVRLFLSRALVFIRCVFLSPFLSPNAFIVSFVSPCDFLSLSLCAHFRSLRPFNASSRFLPAPILRFTLYSSLFLSPSI